MKTIINLTIDEATEVCSALTQYAIANGWSDDELEESGVIAEYGGAVDAALKAMGIEINIGNDDEEEEEEEEEEDYEDEDYEDEDEDEDEDEEDDENEEDYDEMTPDVALKAIFRAIGDLMGGYGE